MNKVFGLLILTLALGALNAPAEAYAQALGAPGGGGFADASKASAGTLIVSVMEQVGYHAQAQVLRDLSELLNWAGALIYLCVLFSMILTVAMHGNYRPALWALVGPPLFFWASGIQVAGMDNTIEGAGVTWRFGAFDDKNVADDQGNILSKQDVGRPGAVAYLFHKYNELISEGTQLVIKAVTENDLRPQMLFMARQRTLEDLFADQISTPGVHALASYFAVHCSTELEMGRIIARGNRNPELRKLPEYEMAKTQYCDRFPKKDKPFEPGAWQDYVFTALLFSGQDITPQDHIEKARYEYAVVSCEQMWNWLQQGAIQNVKATLERLAVSNIEKNSWLIAGSRYWDMTLAAIKKVLTATENLQQRRRESPGDPCATAEDGEAPAVSDFEALAQIIAGYLTRKELLHQPAADLFNRVYAHQSGIVSSEGVHKEVRTNPVQAEDTLRREKAAQFAEARRYEAYMLLNLLPYLQGILLYVLAVTYPFFALMIIVPGQAGTMFTWMALWAWAKVWDIGWALIMVADELLWELLPKTAYVNPDAQGGLSSPINILEAAFDGDHAYSVASYWLLLSGMIIGVPIVSGHAVLGAKKAIANLMLKGVTDLADNLSQAGSDWVGGGHVRGWTARRERDTFAKIAQNSMKFFSGARAQDAALKSLVGDGVISEMLGDADSREALANSLTRLSEAKRELSRATDNAQRSALRKEISALKDKTHSKIVAAHQRLGEKGKGQDLQGATNLATIAALLPGEAGKALLGTDATPDEWLSDQMLNAMGLSPEDIANSTGIEDKELAQKLAEARIKILTLRLYGYQKNDWAEATLAYAAPFAAGIGAGTAGAPGSLKALMSEIDASAAQRRNHFQMQHTAARQQYSLLSNATPNYHYQLRWDKYLFAVEAARAQAAPRGRLEWWGNVHKSVPTDVLYQLDQLQTELDAGLIQSNSKAFHQRMRDITNTYFLLGGGK